MVEKARRIWRDFNTDNVADSGDHDPDKAEIRRWGTWVEENAEGAAAGRVDESTWAELEPIEGTRNGQPARVLGPDAGQHTDPVTGEIVDNIGEYSWSMASHGWGRLRDLENFLVRASNSGEGTANDIQAEPDRSFSRAPYASLITLNFVVANDGPMTVSIGGEPARDLVTNIGQPIPANYVQPGMAALLEIDENGAYRLFSYGDATAIEAAAEKYANYAELWAQSPDPIPVEAGGDGSTDHSSKWWAEHAQDYAAMAGSATGLLFFPTVALLHSDTTLSYTSGSGLVQVAPGDIVHAQGFRYEVAASGATDEHLTTAGGVKLYVLANSEGIINLAALNLSSGDDIHDLIDNAKTAGNRVYIPSGTYTCSPYVFAATDKGLEIFGDSETLLQLTGDFTTNKAVFLNPQVGDGYGGDAPPADDIKIHDLKFDGSQATSTAFTTGVVIAGGKGVKTWNIETFGFLKSGFLVSSEVGHPIDFWGDNIKSYNNGTGSAGQGVATESRNATDSIVFGRIIGESNLSWDFDASGGQTTIQYLHGTGSGSGASGGTLKFTGQNDQKLVIHELHSHAANGVGATTNSGDFTHLYIGHFECIDAASTSLNFAHSGSAYVGSLFSRNSGGSAVENEAEADVYIGKLVSEGGGIHGASLSGASSTHIDQLIAKDHANGAAAVVTSTGKTVLGSVTAINCDTGGVRGVAAAEQNDLTVGSVTVRNDSAGATDPVGVFLNANSVGADIGKITALANSTAIEDNGVGTRLFKKEFRGSRLYGPFTIADGATEEATVVVSGATLGDFAEASFDGLLKGVKVEGEITSGGNATVVFTNNTGASQDIAQGRIYVVAKEK